MLQPGNTGEKAVMRRSRVLTATSRAVMGIGWDRIRLRQRLAQARDREGELLELLRQSEDRCAELEDKLDRFGRLTGAVAHDVNNLLTVVALVGSGLRAQLSPKVREQAD